MSVELATAWVKLVPTTEGIQGELAEALGAPAEKAGEQAGEQAGSRMHDGFVKWGRRAAIGGALALGGFAVHGVKSLGQFETGMNEVFTLLPDMSQSAMDSMNEDVRGFVTEMGVAHDEAVPALYSAISAGVPPDNVMSFMETASMAAIGGATELETAVDGITSVVNAYGEEAMDAETASDMMFTAVKLGKTDMDQLSSSLFNVLPTASALGLGFEDITGAMASMTAQGTPTSVATTQLRSMLNELSQDGSAVGDVFEEVAGTSFKDFIAAGGDTEEALQYLHEHAQDTGVGISDLFGSVEAGNAALALSGDNAEGYAENILAMADSAGATEAAFDQMDQGFERTWENLKIGLTDSAMGFAEELVPALTDLGGILQDTLPGALSGLAEGFNAAMPAVTGLIGFMAENEWVLPMIAGVIGGVLVAAMGIWTASVIANTIALLAWPATWIFLAIVAAAALLAAGIILLWQNWDTFTAFLSSTWDSVINGVQSGLSAFGAFWSSIWSSIMSFLSNLWSGLSTWFTSMISGALSAVRGFVSGFASGWNALWSSVGNFLRSIISTAMAFFTSIVQGGISTGRAIVSGFVGFWSGAWSGILGFLTGVGSNILGFLSSTWSSLYDNAIGTVGDLMSYMGELPGRITGIFSDAGSWLADAGRRIIDGFIDGITGAFGAVRETLGGLTDMLPDWKGPAARDDVLLYGAGQLVIGGFERGLEDEYSSVKNSLNRFTADIPKAAQQAYSDVSAAPAAGGGITVKGPLVEVAEMVVDSDDRTKKVAQELWTRASRADRSKGAVNLGGVVT